MSTQKIIFTLLCLAALLLGSACVPISQNPPPQSAARATMNATGSRITGQVFWASTPAPQAIIELRARAQSEDPASTVQRATADSNGRYVLDGPPVGEYILVAQWPDGGENPSRRTPVNVEPGAKRCGSHPLRQSITYSGTVFSVLALWGVVIMLRGWGDRLHLDSVRHA